MRAMILAAGRGERMRPLTDTMPKPLLCVAGKPLITWHLEKLARAGFKHVVINHAWLGDRIESALGDGSQWGLSIRYSAEGTALETAGGIATALPLLGEEPFLVINGDIWCDWEVSRATQAADLIKQRRSLGWLLLVNNPPHHPEGDFALTDQGHVTLTGSNPLTFSGVGVYDPQLFNGIQPAVPAKLAPLLRQEMTGQRILGEHHQGIWIDVGTPERLKELDQMVRATR